ncbi:hypothetical protein [Kocuria coralli]|uniref:hypothetical protein n=1 Tax=Kocuria coralli TaxID=1461025 RepID=UPI0015F2C42E|nr:hypothetical protein [Kocuria coralli]
MTYPPRSNENGNDEESRTDADEALTDAAIRDLQGRVQGPQVSNSASPAERALPGQGRGQHPEQSWPTSSPTPRYNPVSPIQPPPQRRSVWRSAGVGVLGFVGGVLLALILQDILATAFLREGTIPIALGIVLGFLMPVCGVLGVIVAILIYNRHGKRGSA